MDISYEIHFVQSLIATIVIETMVLYAVVRHVFRVQPREIRAYRCIFAGVIASGTTLPYLWFVAPAFLPSFSLRAAVGEPAVTIVEALLFTQLLNLTLRRSIIASIAANAVSFGLGMIIWALW